MEVLLLTVALLVLAGIASLTFSKSPRLATLLGAGGATLASVLGLAPTLRVLLGGAPEALRWEWDSSHGVFAVAVDPLSAFFLLPVLALSALAATYGGNYLLAYRHRKLLGAPWFFFNIFVAGMVMVLVARTAFLFLVAWEAMSLAAFFLVTFEHEKPEARQAGWVYLIATHLGVAFLILMFLLLGHRAGSLEFAAFRAAPTMSAAWAGVIFVLALVGFGAKAGFVPFHVWLPEAHPAAPSHVSALMSAVMIKMGLYGLLRILTFLGHPAAWWGPTLAIMGLCTALVGITLALNQRDMKRILAYSSIENMGLIGLALGVGLWGWANRLPVVAVLALTAALVHIWNHALMKGLMFFAAGSIFHATGTKNIEQLGGLMKRMPATASAMMAGAVALAALPPGNGFVSKWLIYMSLLKCGIPADDSGSVLMAFLAIGLLALIGGLSAIVFVRLTGITLLGNPRSEAAEHAHEASPWMLGPMFFLIALCLAAAVAPHLVIGLMAGVLDQLFIGETWRAMPELQSSNMPIDILGNINAWTLLALGTVTFLVVAWSRKAACVEGPTWACGYVKPTARMQYTGRSFAEMLAENLLPRFLRPRVTKRAPQGLFPQASGFEADCGDPVSEKVYAPFFRRWAERLSRLHVLQHGIVNVYLVYILLMVMAALAWDAIPWAFIGQWWAAS
jgi:formate hydrogenlyase subunit 3/multisubunit Na+/H+ antiporter MnhD subunit